MSLNTNGCVWPVLLAMEMHCKKMHCVFLDQAYVSLRMVTHITPLKWAGSVCVSKWASNTGKQCPSTWVIMPAHTVNPKGVAWWNNYFMSMCWYIRFSVTGDSVLLSVDICSRSHLFFLPIVQDANLNLTKCSGRLVTPQLIMPQVQLPALRFRSNVFRDVCLEHRIPTFWAHVFGCDQYSIQLQCISACHCHRLW